MASSYTSNYNLCQWAADDKVLRTEFNADNAKIDAAIKAVDQRANSLQSALDGKADVSALDSLKNTVGQQAGVLAGKGNCQICVTSYVGSGKCGEENPNRLTFAQKPVAVFVCGTYSLMTLIQGVGTSWADSDSGGGSSAVYVSWSGNSVSWYGSQTYSQLSSPNATYRVLALLQAD